MDLSVQSGVCGPVSTEWYLWTCQYRVVCVDLLIQSGLDSTHLSQEIFEGYYLRGFQSPNLSVKKFICLQLGAISIKP